MDPWRESQKAIEKRTVEEAGLRVSPRMKKVFGDALDMISSLDLPEDYRQLAKGIVLRRCHAAAYTGIQGNLPGMGTSTITISLLTGDVEILVFDTVAAPIRAEHLLEAYVHELIHALKTGRNEDETHRLSGMIMGKKPDDYAGRRKWTVELQEVMLMGMKDPSYLDVLSGVVSKEEAKEARWALMRKAYRLLHGSDGVGALAGSYGMLRRTGQELIQKKGTDAP